MATISIKKCEKCGVEARQDTEKALYDKFICVDIKCVRYTTRLRARYYYELCPTCQIKLGIFPTDEKEFTGEENKNIQDRLYDIIAEIVADTQQ